jgi:hypothetical protein
MGDTVQNIATIFSIDHDNLMHGVQRQRRRSIIRDFALNTSTHGLPGIARSRSLHNRLFWSLSTLAFTGVTLYFVIQSIQDYFKYPKQTSLDIAVDWPIPFPAFTFCNNCPTYNHEFQIGFQKYLKERNITVPNDTSLQRDRFLALFNEFRQLLLNDRPLMSTMMFSIDQMLISCHFNKEPCNKSDFINFISPSFGSCYTFNAVPSNQSNNSVRDSNSHGGQGVLKLELYTHIHQYTPYLCDGK